MSDTFRDGFEVAKKAAIRCAEQWRYYNLMEHDRGCKAVQGVIETIESLDPSRFDMDGNLIPETYVEYDRQKHGPIVNGRVKI